jgi:hypothetical protein
METTIEKINAITFGYGVEAIEEKWSCGEEFALYCTKIQTTTFDISSGMNQHKCNSSYSKFDEFESLAHEHFLAIIDSIRNYFTEDKEYPKAKKFDYYAPKQWWMDDAIGSNDEVDPMVAEFTRLYVENHVHIEDFKELKDSKDFHYKMVIEIMYRQYVLYIDESDEIYYAPDELRLTMPKLEELVKEIFKKDENDNIDCIYWVIEKMINEYMEANGYGE